MDRKIVLIVDLLVFTISSSCYKRIRSFGQNVYFYGNKISYSYIFKKIDKIQMQIFCGFVDIVGFYELLWSFERKPKTSDHVINAVNREKRLHFTRIINNNQNIFVIVCKNHGIVKQFDIFNKLFIFR